MSMKRFALAALLVGFATGHAYPQTLPPLLDPDHEADRVNWYDLNTKFGAPPKLPADTRLGGVVKTFVNKFWRATADGMEQGAKTLGDPHRHAGRPERERPAWPTVDRPQHADEALRRPPAVAADQQQPAADLR